MSSVRSIRMSGGVKGLTVLAVLFLGAVTWFTVNRSLGAMVAANTTSKEVAEVGTALAPDSAWAHHASGLMLERTFLPQDLIRSREEFEKAVTLSPNDFRLWLDLARSYEKNNDMAKAESAFRRTLELAPNYSQVQWTVGNFLLRQDRNEEAFELIRRAASADINLSSSASAVAWSVYDGDLQRIRGYFGDSTSLRGGLAVFLAGQGRMEDAMDVWSTISRDEMKGSLAPLGEVLFEKLLAAKRYLLVVKFLSLQDKVAPGPGQISNGGFEEKIYLSGADIFDWKFAEGDDTQIGVDPEQVREGRRETALAIVFKSDGRSFRTVSQTVPVEPGVKYLFRVAYRSALEYRTTMRWEVLSAADSSVLAATPSIAEKSDWNSVSAEFTVPDKTEGVVVRLVRSTCDSIICPIAGKVWFDDVSMTRARN